jgi:cysteinyl-tRNA synthetase
MPDFQLYNTLTRRVDAIVPAEADHLRFYSCGPTVYSYAHIGNFRSFLTADLICRTAQALGWRVTYVSNVTDVGHLTEDDVADAGGEDKMEKALRSKEGEQFANVWDLARHYTGALQQDWKRLNLLEPTVRPRATEHITGQIEAIERLMSAGHAYETAQGVYFRVRSFPSYGKLSGNTLDSDTQAGARELVTDDGKEDPRDFALWKRDDKHLMQWYSPYGRGFPGWHLECSVMAQHYLGDTIDLHAGGEDLIFPHHECEIAQSEALTGQPFARAWVHTRFLQVEGEKMSKSKGNFYTVRDLVEGRGVDPLVLRYALLSGQYRKPLNFTDDHLVASARVVERYRDARTLAEQTIAKRVEGPDRIGERLEAVYDRTLAALCDDLNTPAAFAAALEGVKLVHGLGDNLNAASAQAVLDWLGRTNDLLGFLAHDEPTAASAPDETEARVEELVALRTQVRAARDWAESDRLRDAVLALGYEIRDTAEGTTWQKRLG